MAPLMGIDTLGLALNTLFQGSIPGNNICKTLVPAFGSHKAAEKLPTD